MIHVTIKSEVPHVSHFVFLDREVMPGHHYLRDIEGEPVVVTTSLSNQAPRNAPRSATKMRLCHISPDLWTSHRQGRLNVRLTKLAMGSKLWCIRSFCGVDQGQATLDSCKHSMHGDLVAFSPATTSKLAAAHVWYFSMCRIIGTWSCRVNTDGAGYPNIVLLVQNP